MEREGEGGKDRGREQKEGRENLKRGRKNIKSPHFWTEAAKK